MWPLTARPPLLQAQAALTIRACFCSGAVVPDLKEQAPSQPRFPCRNRLFAAEKNRTKTRTHTQEESAQNTRGVGGVGWGGGGEKGKAQGARLLGAFVSLVASSAAATNAGEKCSRHFRTSGLSNLCVFDLPLSFQKLCKHCTSILQLVLGGGANGAFSRP